MSLNAVDSFVRVRNDGDTVFVGKFDLKPFRFQPGQAHFVPWYAAKQWLGDPHAQDTGALCSRTLELTRLRTLYGIYNREITDRFQTWEATDGQKLGFPRLVVEDATGNVIPMLVDIEYGDDRERPPDNPLDTNAMLAAMQAQIAKLQAMVANTEHSQVTEVPSLGLPDEDDLASALDLTTGAPEDAPPAARPGRVRVSKD